MTTEETPMTHLPLTAQDRCDSCGAAAALRAWKDELELLFCLHHMKKNCHGLWKAGFKIETSELLETRQLETLTT